jgi:hypothetical protein
MDLLAMFIEARVGRGNMGDVVKVVAQLEMRFYCAYRPTQPHQKRGRLSWFDMKGQRIYVYGLGSKHFGVSRGLSGR